MQWPKEHMTIQCTRIHYTSSLLKAFNHFILVSLGKYQRLNSHSVHMEWIQYDYYLGTLL